VRQFAAIIFLPSIPGGPPNGAVLDPARPGRFVCSEVNGAARYEIEIRSLDEQREPVRVSTTPYCEGDLPQLPPGRYRWQAFAFRPLPDGRTLRSQPGPAREFTIVGRSPAQPTPPSLPTPPAPPAPPSPQAPGSGAQQPTR
jgi:hypothetical protein